MVSTTIKRNIMMAILVITEILLILYFMKITTPFSFDQKIIGIPIVLLLILGNGWIIYHLWKNKMI